MTFHFWLLQGVWAGAILIVFYCDYWHIGQSMKEVALVEARAYLQKDEAIRRWGASHGGVYVPVSKKTRPNPFLEKVPERDIRTPGGRLLTLMNPAYMMRQITADYNQKYHVRGHITSLKYFRKETAPDEWECKALAAFKNGVGEVHEFTRLDGKSCLRIMRPLITEASCLKCHAAQGSKLGDIRGGVSLALPMGSYSDVQRGEMASHALSFGVLWLMGAAGFWWAASRVSLVMKKNDETHLDEKRQAVSQLQASERRLKHFAARLMQHQEKERRVIALEIQEDIAQSLSAVKWSMEASLGADSCLAGAESRSIQSVIERINEIIDLIRRLTRRLSPVMLDTLGIEFTLMVLCEEVMKSRPDSIITPRIDIPEKSIPGELEIVVYRVLEDILKLAVRPGRRDRCTVALALRNNNLELVVGRMGPHMRALIAASEWHPALLTIKNRAESFGGVLKTESGQEDGCAIAVNWPLREQT
jgi:signal transduction histidine kinase